MPHVVAIASNHRGVFVANQPPDSPPARGLETTKDLDDARRFVNQSEVDTWVAARGGVVGAWIAWELP